MRRLTVAALGLAVAAAVGVSALADGDGVDVPEVGQAPVLGGNTPLAPEDMEEPDPAEFTPFIEGEPTFDLDSIPFYDEEGNLVPNPGKQG